MFDSVVVNNGEKSFWVELPDLLLEYGGDTMWAVGWVTVGVEVIRMESGCFSQKGSN